MYKSNFEYDLMLCVLESSLEEDLITLEALENESDADDVLSSLFVLEAEGAIAEKLGKVKEIISSAISKAVGIAKVIFDKAMKTADGIDQMYTDFYKSIRDNAYDKLEVKGSDVNEIVITENQYRTISQLGGYLSEVQAEYEKALSTYDTEKMRAVKKEYQLRYKSHKVKYFKKKIITTKEAMDLLDNFSKGIVKYRQTAKAANKNFVTRIKNAESLSKKAGITVNQFLNAVMLVNRLMFEDMEALMHRCWIQVHSIVNKGIRKGRKREKKLAKQG